VFLVGEKHDVDVRQERANAPHHGQPAEPGIEDAENDQLPPASAAPLALTGCEGDA
jgi:hypothetical protein